MNKHAQLCFNDVFVFSMWGNSIGDNGAHAFAEAIKNHGSLTNLR